MKKSKMNKFSAFYFTDHLRYFGYQLVLGKQFHANIVNKKFKVTSVAENQAKTRFMVGKKHPGKSYNHAPKHDVLSSPGDRNFT